MRRVLSDVAFEARIPLALHGLELLGGSSFIIFFFSFLIFSILFFSFKIIKIKN